MAQWLGHLVWDQGIGGSNPLIPTKPAVSESSYRFNGSAERDKIPDSNRGRAEWKRGQAYRMYAAAAEAPGVSRQDAGERKANPLIPVKYREKVIDEKRFHDVICVSMRP